MITNYVNSKSTRIISSTATSGTFKVNTYVSNGSTFIALAFAQVYAVYIDWSNAVVRQECLTSASDRGLTFSISDASNHIVGYAANSALWGGIVIIGT